jgi:histidine triad (HIT) family protein
MGCEYCDIIQGKRKATVLYSDESIIAFLAPKPATIGHVVVAPKRHYPILETLGEDIVSHSFKVANALSSAVFQAIKCEGTNILVHNGIAAGQRSPHFSINVIARKQGDGLNFEWKPRKVESAEMEDILQKIKQQSGRKIGERDKTSEKKEEKKEGKESANEDTKDTGKADVKDYSKEGTDTATKEETNTAPKDETKDTAAESEESYLIRQLRRMP